jgi:apolipoprotein D and lipocalin family protein
MRAVLFAAFVSLAPSLALADEQQVVQLDVERYLGTWYDIAHVPFYFQRGCTGSTATYSKGEGQDLKVVNRCNVDALDGPEKSVTGKAWTPDPKVPGKLKVQFFWPFSGDYWVLEAGPNYEYAVVGNAKKSSTWVLSRTPVMDEALYQAILERLKARGYDVGKLEKTLQR